MTAPEWPTFDPDWDAPLLPPPAATKPKAPTHGRCKASCCKTPYGHAMSVRGCACHPADET